MAPGIVDVILLVFFGLGGSVGPPMGLSPAPEDPLMAAIAPDECLAYTTWSGSIVPAADGNTTEQWMAQPEIQGTWKKLQSAYLDYCRIGEEQENEAFLNSAAIVARHCLTHALALYVTDTSVTEFGPFEVLTGGAIVELGENPGELMAQIDSIAGFVTNLVERQVETISIEGRNFQTMLVPNAIENRITWGMVDEHHFAIAIGDGEMERLLARMKTPPPQWLTTLRENLPVDRVSSVSWIDGEKAVNIFMEPVRQVGMIEKDQAMELLGLGQIRGIGMVAGLDDQGFVGRTRMVIDGKPTGMFSLFSDEPLTAGMISRIPDDRMLAVAVAVSPTRILELVQEVIGNNEFLGSGFQTALSGFNESAGIDLKSDVIDRLDENVFFHGSFNLANPYGGWVVGIGASGEMGLYDPLEKIVGLLRENAGEEYEISESNVNGNTVYTYVDKQGWSGLGGASWSLANGELLFSMDQSSLRRHLRREPLADDALARDEWFAGLFTPPSANLRGPVMISSLDVSHVLELAVPFSAPFVGRVIPEGFDFSMEDIPSLSVLNRGMKPNLTAIYRTPDGFETVQRQTYPGGSPLNLVPALGVTTLPAILQMARNARRIDSANRMRQLVLLMHTYHDAHKAFPARFNMNEAGEPLLSWRVHILPFMGYQDLYNSFNLDEPWDSDHNKSLIERMPEEFAHPVMKLDPGKTAYVVPQGTDSVMTEPVDSRTSPRGSKLQLIQDGTSRTALVLEVAEENAVIWTQPTDYAWEEIDQPVTGLYTGWKTGLHLGMCDGSVHFLSGEKIKQIFEALVKTNDGEIIDLWNNR